MVSNHILWMFVVVTDSIETKIAPCTKYRHPQGGGVGARPPTEFIFEIFMWGGGLFLLRGPFSPCVGFYFFLGVLFLHVRGLFFLMWAFSLGLPFPPPLSKNFPGAHNAGTLQCARVNH